MTNLTNTLFRTARTSADARAITTGHIPRRAKNKLIGRGFARAGIWRALWK